MSSINGNGTMTPDPWADSNAVAGLPQNHHQQQQFLQNGSPQYQQQQQQQQPSPTSSIATGPAPSAPHEDQLDRQMLRHLLSKYNTEDLNRLISEENSSALSHGETASVLTTSTYSSAKSDDAQSVFDSGSSIRALSDTSSARGSIISNMSARTAQFLNRKSRSSVSSAPQPSTLTNDSSSTISQCDADGTAETGSMHSGTAKQKGTFECGFCKEEGLNKTCTRKNDLKRHIEDFHNMNAQWHCHHRDCGMVFDWQTVFKSHLKSAHGGSRMPVDDAKVTLCPQTVFACGFDNCIQVFEAQSDAEAAMTFKEYVAHVVKHLDEGSNSGEWNYSTRMRNLMRQSGVLRAWTHSQWDESDRNRLTWHTQSSNILRKRLETRHLGDLRMLVEYAQALGSSGPNGVPELHENFCLPIQNQCRMQIPGHANNMRLQAPPAPMAPHQPHHQMQPQAPEPDPYSFKISRGNGVNPQLASYYAAQRQVQYGTTRPPVRSGRSARPPGRTVPATTVAPQQNIQPPAPNIFDPGQYYQPQQYQQQQQNQQQFQMMAPDNGGIIADDLRSLRSFASSNNSADIDMSDAQMMDTSYMGSQPDFSAPYATGGLQSPAPSDHGLKMEQGHYGNFDQRF